MIGTAVQTQTHRRRRWIAVFDPLPWQIAPWRDKSATLLLTGSAGGGKSRLAAEKLHGYCLRYPGSTALVLRKVRVSLTNSTIPFLERVIIGEDPRVNHLSSKSRFEYANGSVLAYGGLEDEEQRRRLRSFGVQGGIDIAWMEEATEFVEDDFNALTARMRGRAATWRQILLSTNPDSPTHWIYGRLIVAGEAHTYYSGARDNPHNPPEYIDTLGRLTGVEGDRLAGGQWVQASGLVYDVWSDGPADGNVTELAEFQLDAGTVFWGADDGYAGKRDSATGLFTADSHPRVFLLCQEKPDGHLDIFAESYAVGALQEAHIQEVLSMGYPEPEYAVVDKAAAELRGRLHAAGIQTVGSPSDVEESIKVARRLLAPDGNNWRRIRVHPRCKHVRAEMASYRRDPQTEKPVKQFDHGPDVVRYISWLKRNG